MRPMGRFEGPSAMMGKPPALFAKKNKMTSQGQQSQGGGGDGRARTLPESRSEPVLIRSASSTPSQGATTLPNNNNNSSNNNNNNNSNSNNHNYNYNYNNYNYGGSNSLARCQSASSASSNVSRLRQQEQADAVDRLLKEEKLKKEEHQQRAKEERQMEQTRRMAQRKMLTEKAQREHQRFVRKMQESVYQQRSRMAKRLQGSPLTQDLVELQEHAERSRGSPTSVRPSSASSSVNPDHQRVIQERVDAVDPLDMLRNERRRLLDRERELKYMMSVEKTRQRSEIAEKNRPNNTAEFEARKQLKEDEAMMKQEFMRLLSGWNGHKVKTRNKPVEQLWQEHKNKLLSGAYFLSTEEQGHALEDAREQQSEASSERTLPTFDGRDEYDLDGDGGGFEASNSDNNNSSNNNSNNSNNNNKSSDNNDVAGIERGEEDDEQMETASQATIPKPLVSEALAETWTLP